MPQVWATSPGHRTLRRWGTRPRASPRAGRACFTASPRTALLRNPSSTQSLAIATPPPLASGGPWTPRGGGGCPPSLRHCARAARCCWLQWGFPPSPLLSRSSRLGAAIPLRWEDNCGTEGCHGRWRLSPSLLPALSRNLSLTGVAVLNNLRFAPQPQLLATGRGHRSRLHVLATSPDHRFSGRVRGRYSIDTLPGCYYSIFRKRVQPAREPLSWYTT